MRPKMIGQAGVLFAVLCGGLVHGAFETSSDSLDKRSVRGGGDCKFSGYVSVECSDLYSPCTGTLTLSEEIVGVGTHRVAGGWQYAGECDCEPGSPHAGEQTTDRLTQTGCRAS